jgi:DNA-binding LytR/AlgR family response regulator
VEDEPHAQKELKRILEKVRPGMEILGMADGIETAVSMLSRFQPDLIFMDIQLSDGQSFEIFNRTEVNCPVIFTTAYDAYALQAFKSNGIDYLLKPIEPEDIRKALDKFDMVRASGQGMPAFQADQLRQLLQPGGSGYKTRFMTNIGDRIRFLNDTEIAYFQADNEVVFMVSHDKKKYIVNHTLEQLEPMLNPAQFFRINRSYIVHVDSIADIHKHFNSRLKLKLQPEPEDEILVSRARVGAFLAWIGQ